MQEHSAGDEVMVTGLVSKPIHNGCDARVLSFDGATGRYTVETARGDLLALKPANLVAKFDPKSVAQQAARLSLLCDGLLKGAARGLELAALHERAEAPPDAPGGGGQSKLHQAAYSGSITEVAALLAADPHAVSSRDLMDNTPLHVAAFAGHVHVTAKLLSAGASVHATDVRRFTPLHRAALEGQVECAALLLQHGASAKAAGAENNTPLHLLASARHQPSSDPKSPTDSLAAAAAAAAISLSVLTHALPLYAAAQWPRSTTFGSLSCCSRTARRPRHPTSSPRRRSTSRANAAIGSWCGGCSWRSRSQAPRGSARRSHSPSQTVAPPPVPVVVVVAAAAVGAVATGVRAVRAGMAGGGALTRMGCTTGRRPRPQWTVAPSHRRQATRRY